jgi:hypothetical protein
VPYPPRPQRKHPDLTPSEARTRHLQPYKWQPGESGNAMGFPKSRREQLELIEAAAREKSLRMVEILSEMAESSEDERVRVMAAKTLLEYLPKPAPEPVDSAPVQRSPQELAELLEWAASAAAREWLAKRLNGHAPLIESAVAGEDEQQVGS